MKFEKVMIGMALFLSAAGLVVHGTLAAPAPSISDVQVTDVEATSTTVTWTTDTKTDSFVNYSESSNYCSVRNSGALGNAHSVVIPDLDPGTTYFFRVRATDQAGNQSFSGDFTFTTTSSVSLPSAQKISDASQRNIAQKAASLVGELTSPAALQAVAQVVSSQGQKVLAAPQIIGNPDLAVEAQQATVSWKTDEEADSIVYIASQEEYTGGGDNPYARKEGDASAAVLDHEVVVYGLTPDTVYHYKVSSQGAVGPAGESADLTFKTKSFLPQIMNARVIKVQEHSATISWSTPLPSAGTIEYTNLNNRRSLSVGDPTPVAAHSIQLNNLEFRSRYSAVIKAQNQAGDVVASEPLFFVTTKDIIPPAISQVNNDSTLYPGQDSKVQTIISWQTDEPASCNLSYVKGIVKSDKENVTGAKEEALLQNHVDVVTDFAPDTVYKYWVTCTDADGNATSSEDFVLLTPQQEKSIIDIIVGNFKSTFGWLNGLGGKSK